LLDRPPRPRPLAMPENGRLIVEQIPHLRRYALALLGNRAEADDLVQDCLERAWSRIGLWRRGGSIRPWLFTIMHNLYVNGISRRRSGPQFQALPEDIAAAVPAEQETRAEARNVSAALALLPPEQREVLILVAVEEMGYAEAAAVLGIPIGTVMSRLHRARERLRAITSGSPGGPVLRRVK